MKEHLYLLREQKKINQSEIVMMKADINYTTIYFQNGEKITVSKTLKILETTLNNSNFHRIHRRTLINRNHILAYNTKLGEVLLINNYVTFISRRRKDDFDKIFNIN
jgi:DNA-binding LytR/AlgR family response regulator